MGCSTGWAIVAVLVVFTAMGVGLAGANIAVFIEPTTREMGWSPVAFGWAQMARLEAVIIAGPVLGRVIDRYGPQVPVAIAGVVSSRLVVSLASVTEEWQLVRCSWTWSEAVPSPTFWVLVLRFTLFTYGWPMITIFHVPHFIKRGLNPTLVALAVATDAVVAIVVSALLGRLSDLIPFRYIMVLTAAGLLVSAGSLLVVDGVLFLFTAIGPGPRRGVWRKV